MQDKDGDNFDYVKGFWIVLIGLVLQTVSIFI
jgi:hypothetical protein